MFVLHVPVETRHVLSLHDIHDIHGVHVQATHPTPCIIKQCLLYSMIQYICCKKKINDTFLWQFVL